MSEFATYRPHRYRSADGRLDLYARDYQGEGPALLLMHGLTRNSADFEPLIEHLAGRYRLIVPDQRGRGLSEYDGDPANYRPDIYSADMFALLDDLGVARASLIGTSMGALMAMIMAATQSARVSAMVLNDAGPVVEEAGLARIQGYVGLSTEAADWDEAAARCASINGSAFPGYGAQDWLAFARRTFGETENGKIRLAYDSAISESFKVDGRSAVPSDLWPLWVMLTALPVLVVRGALSDLLCAATVEEMRRRHEGPFFAAEIPDRGHAPMLDEPAALAAIKPFLAQYAL